MKQKYVQVIELQLLKGFILFILATSGLGFAVFLRELGYNGSTIASVAIILEAVCLVLSYLLLRKYVIIKEEENGKKRETKGKFK